jgi:predicted DNA-binding protein YlxM (UPF0122 family)
MNGAIPARVEETKNMHELLNTTAGLLATAMTNDGTKCITPMAISLADLATATSVFRATIYNEIARGKLKVRKIGTRTVVEIEEARRWLRGEPPRAE